MNNEEAIETIKIAIADVEWNYPLNYTVAFEVTISALEKQIPKKLISTPDKHKHFCPACHQQIKLGRQYCGNCGQKMGYGSDTE